MIARDEELILSDLRELCSSQGFVHAIAYFCFRDVMVHFSGYMTPADLNRHPGHERLIRTEISTLIGYMARAKISYAYPGSEVVQVYIDQAQALLLELHHALGKPFEVCFKESLGEPNPKNPFTLGPVLREPIFYGGEAAYVHQYRDLSLKKFEQDNEWLKSHMGFTIQEAVAVSSAVIKALELDYQERVRVLRTTPFTDWDVTTLFAFTSNRVIELTGLERSTVESVLSAFTFSHEDRNDSFFNLNDFNLTNAKPLLQKGPDEYVLFNPYSLAEALYESPFFWMMSDRSYMARAAQHRGEFTERFCRERLELVFGSLNVYSGVNIFESKSTIVGEIDVLVIFGNRAIVLQAKSKTLTIEARKGNEGQIQDDFKKSVKDAYNQGLDCARLLTNRAMKFFDSEAKEIDIPETIKEIHIFCVVSDNYPALSFQVDQFLEPVADGPILMPLVMDVFTLDAMTEMLQSPLQFLSYIRRRVDYTGKITAMHELTILSYHLKKNLWLDDGMDVVWLADEISSYLDVAMMVRRDGVKGKATPDGILTRFLSTPFDRLIQSIEQSPASGLIDLGFLLLSLGEDAIREFNSGINLVSKLARQDHRHHDFSIGIGDAKSGITLHCNDDAAEISEPRLRRHCVRRKYLQKADSWYGLWIRPADCAPRGCLVLDEAWTFDSALEEISRRPIQMGTSLRMLTPAGIKKVGRNAPCPCGSGSKFKKCCGS